MSYKLMALAVVLLIGTPAFGQEFSPITVKTGGPTPSTVRTGGHFKVTYHAEFYDEVLIVEEQMQPENIVADPFEVIGLEIVVLPPRGSDETGIIHVQDFIYTFRIIKPEKGDKKIPSFNFIWVIKKAGMAEVDAKEGNELKEIPTDEVKVRYVYSPTLNNIRDEMVFPFFRWSGATLRNAGYGVIVGSLILTTLAIVFILIGYPVPKVVWVSYKKAGNKKINEKNSEEKEAEELVAETYPGILIKKTRKKFICELKSLLKSKDIDAPSVELEKKVFSLLRGFVLAELSGAPIKASISDTPCELYKRLAEQKEKMGSRHKIFSFLTGKMRNYYEDMESGQLVHFMEPRLEIRSLLFMVEGTGFWKRLKENLRNSFRILHV